MFRSLSLGGLFLLFATTSPLFAESWSGTASVLGGVKFLEDDWEPAEDQTEYGVQFDVTPPEWPLAFAIDFLAADSGSESVDLPAGGSLRTESETSEIALGVRKYWSRTERWHPFVGGGLALIDAKVDSNGPLASASSDDRATGWWASGGLRYDFNNRIHVGAQARYSYGDVDLNGAELNAGGLHFLAMFGFRWGEDDRS